MEEDFITALNNDYSVDISPMVGKAFRQINQRMLEAFFPNVKQATGKWVYEGYRWHAYSFHYENAVTGKSAFARYREQPLEAFFIYHEFEDKLLECQALTWPDIRRFCNDIYVFPASMNWLFSTTHEAAMGLGPYFAPTDMA